MPDAAMGAARAARCEGTNCCEILSFTEQRLLSRAVSNRLFYARNHAVIDSDAVGTRGR